MRTRLVPARDRRLTAAAALVAAGALILAGCGSDSSTEQAAPTEQTTSAGSTPAALAQALAPGETETADPAAKPADTAPKGEEATDLAENRHMVTAIRVGEHQGKDRVVFELSGPGVPGYSVDYVDAPAQQGSGHPVEVAGDSFLQVTIGNQTLPTEGGPTEVPVGTVSADEVSGVAGVAFAGQFEAQAQAVIGLEGADRAFTTFTLQNPTRVVVDVEK